MALLTGKYPHQIGMTTMSGDLHPEHPTFLRALQAGGYHTSWIGKLHLLQGWDWYGRVTGGHNLRSLNEVICAKVGLDYLWESSGKFLIQRNYCDWAAQLHEAGLLRPYFEHLSHCGGNRFRVEPGCLDRVRPWPFDERHYADIATADRTIRELERHDGSRPFFIACSFCGPHVPYDPPSRFLTEFDGEPLDPIQEPESGYDAETFGKLHEMQRAYKGMIRCIDDQIGRILETLESRRLLDRTVIIFTSDHGEMLGDHGLLQKGFPRSASLAVPLVLRHPLHQIQRINDSPVELGDVTATILEIAGQNPQLVLAKSWPSYHSIVPCRSLMPIIKGQRERVREVAFAESDANWHRETPDPDSNWQVLFDGFWKYVRYTDIRGADPDHYQREELFDLNSDPGERVNRANSPECAEKIRYFRKQLDFIVRTTPPAQTSWAPLERRRD